MIWSLEELKKMALPGLQRLDGELRKKVIGIAEKQEPIVAYDLIEATLKNCGWAPKEAVQIARSVSWLAVARRQNEEFFSAIVAEI